MELRELKNCKNCGADDKNMFKRTINPINNVVIYLCENCGYGGSIRDNGSNVEIFKKNCGGIRIKTSESCELMLNLNPQTFIYEGIGTVSPFIKHSHTMWVVKDKKDKQIGIYREFYNAKRSLMATVNGEKHQNE